MKKIKIKKGGQGTTLVSGASHCFENREAAMRASKTYTTSPGALMVEGACGEDLWLAGGEWSTDGNPSLWGRRGAVVEVVGEEEKE